MDIGVMLFPTDRSIGPVELARAVEERGLHSLYFPEHTHIPVIRRTPYPAGGELPEEYKRTHDPFLALTAAAVATERIQLGTGVCLVAQRDPIVTAKAVASLDVLSGGRFVFGIGVGWNEDEMGHHGVDPRRRRAVAREHVLAMKALWTQEEASFEGEHVHLEPSWSWPKPVQRPHPPILLGGAGGPVTFRHVVEYCDGFMPIGGRGVVRDRITELRQVALEAGRDPDALLLKVFGVRPKPDTLQDYADAGVGEVIVGLPSAEADVVLPLLDRCAGLVGAV
ncbi:MAG: LLM class F420-dependent oxidoreductase [Actinomycetota bacterium]|nr:LLM class F420-dependent oxidoreductase [Actinomycetota bacterium]